MTGTHSLNYTYNGKFQTPVLWRMLCKPHPLLCAWIAQLQSNSGQTWRIEYQCFNLNRDKKPWPSFVRRQKNYNWKKIELKLFGPHLKVGSTSKGFNVKKTQDWKAGQKVSFGILYMLGLCHVRFYICWDYTMSDGLLPNLQKIGN